MRTTFPKLGLFLLILLLTGTGVQPVFGQKRKSPVKKTPVTAPAPARPDFGCGDEAAERAAVPSVPARLLRVENGDSLVVSTKKNRRLKIRLAGCDAGAANSAVTTRIRQVLTGKSFTVIGAPVEGGPMDAIVETAQGDLNGVLVEEGLVRFRGGKYENRVPRATLCVYEKLSQNARRQSRGRWKDGFFDGLRSYATIVTDLGTIKIELFPNDAPKTVENFRLLANGGKYDNLIFHRVIRNFMIQGGDPTGTGMSGDSAFGGDFEDEIDANSPLYREIGYVPGVVAMANKGPNTNGSQFFIMHAKVPLPPSYTIFGRVLEGQDVVDRIATVRTGPGDRPLQPVHIISAKVTEE